ncbi:MAG TPA: hypothetical protein VHQ70_01790 [Syntrophomonadaceae bacterium]|nr:hypothetical protein [Syntrophomonadaceae bacterium]
MNKEKIMITNLEEISELLDDRGITQADVQEAIAFGEKTGKKFYRCDDENRFLTRAKVGKFNVYAEYSPNGDDFILHTAYAHRLMISSDDVIDEENEGGPKTEWNCYMCHVEVEEVGDIAMHYNEVELPPIDGYRCPKCKVELLSENIVMTMLFMAEQMLEAK